MFDTIFHALVKTGSLQFENPDECLGFRKLAQGMMPQMTPDMMQQMQQMQQMPQGGMPQEGMPQMPQEMPAQQEQMPPQSIGGSPSLDAMLVGESISSKDIESLVKIINVMTTLKGQYDMMKKDQMSMLQDQMKALQGGAA